LTIIIDFNDKVYFIYKNLVLTIVSFCKKKKKL